MTKKIKISELSEFDPTKYLDDDEAVAHYISLAIEDGACGWWIVSDHLQHNG